MVFKTQKEPQNTQKVTNFFLALIKDRLEQENSPEENSIVHAAQIGIDKFSKFDKESRRKLMLNVGKYQQMFVLPNDTDIVVRRNFYKLFNEGYEYVTFNPQLIEDFIESKQLYKEFNDRGISIPKFSYVLSHNIDYQKEDVPEIFIVAERVKGEQVSKLLNKDSDQKLVNGLEDVFIKSIDYIDEKIQVGKKFMIDIHLEQFMYGITKSDTVPKIYFIDIENRFLESDETKDRFRMVWQYNNKFHQEDNFEKVCTSILNMQTSALKEIESKTGKRLLKLRIRLKDFMEKYGAMYYESATRKYNQNLKNYEYMKNEILINETDNV